MTRTPRYHNTHMNSFFGYWFYGMTLDDDHPLVALLELIDWEELTGHLIKLYKGKGLVGRYPYNPAILLKMLFLSFLYGHSERYIERDIRDSLSTKYFLGLDSHLRAPDHSTLTAFKNRVIAQGNWEPLALVFDGVIQQAMAHVLELGPTQVGDSAHTVANVNNQKDRERQEKRQPPRDPDAQIVNTGKCEVVGSDGRKRTRQIRYRGYKTHVSVNGDLLAGVYDRLPVHPRGDDPEAPFSADFRSNAGHVGM